MSYEICHGAVSGCAGECGGECAFVLGGGRGGRLISVCEGEFKCVYKSSFLGGGGVYVCACAHTCVHVSTVHVFVSYSMYERVCVCFQGYGVFVCVSHFMTETEREREKRIDRGMYLYLCTPLLPLAFTVFSCSCYCKAAVTGIIMVFQWEEEERRGAADLL